MRRPRVLLLDLDDTILDNRSSVYGAWEVVSVRVSERLPALEARRVRDGIAESTRWFWSDAERRRRGRVDLPMARREILADALTRLGHPSPELVRETEALYTRHRDEALRPLPGAIEILPRLRAAVARLGLVTNGASEVQRSKIERFDLERHFDAIVIEGEFGAGKPDPPVFRHAVSVLGAVPVECWMVGDDYEADVLGALHAGLDAVWVDRSGRAGPPTPAPRPHATIRSLVDLPELLRKGGFA